MAKVAKILCNPPWILAPYRCEAMSQRLHLVKIKDKHQIIRNSYLKGLFAFSCMLEFAEEKNMYRSLLQDTAPGIPLDLVFTLYK